MIYKTGIKCKVLSFEWKSDGVMGNKTGESDKDFSNNDFDLI